MCPRSQLIGLMIGFSVELSWASSRWATRANVRSRTCAITTCSSSATRPNIHGSYVRFRSGNDLDQTAEPPQREPAGGDEQEDRTAGERRGDFFLLRARGQPRAQVGVDLLDLVGFAGLVLAA